VIDKAYELLGIERKNSIAITMPGFGTTDRTYQNALNLITSYGATLKEISIKDACIQHFRDIGHDENIHDITYENTQARERTQILMDVANQEGALVIGTGDLSELALGRCTYNGDHMSMYAVNTSIPKTLVRYLVEYVAQTANNPEITQTINDILATPISPELLPPDQQGNIQQKTEHTVGPYVLHDFFLYHFMRYGASPKKILDIATRTFQGEYERETIKHWLKKFITRFFSQQFKRSCLPDGPKV
jgi:NAD+ synthase (glutamine-hydrolysing)